MHSGGKGANQAVAVARLGHQSILLGVLGDDIFGSQLLSTLKSYGVDTSRVGFAAGSSGTASIVVDAQGENTIILTPGSNLQVTSEYLRANLDVLRGAGIVLTQLEIPTETILFLAECCLEFGVPLMLDPAPARELPAELLSKVTWFTPNQTEAAFFADAGESTEQILTRFIGMGIGNVILKQGVDGAIVANADGSRCRIDAFPVVAVDTTAAGDAFNGAFCVALMKGQSPAESGRFASAAAAISVTRQGAQPSLPNKEEIRELLSSCTLQT